MALYTVRSMVRGDIQLNTMIVVLHLFFLYKPVPPVKRFLSFTFKQNLFQEVGFCQWCHLMFWLCCYNLVAKNKNLFINDLGDKVGRYNN
jgi:hypothetical protein